MKPTTLKGTESLFPEVGPCGWLLPMVFWECFDEHETVTGKNKASPQYACVIVSANSRGTPLWARHYATPQESLPTAHWYCWSSSLYNCWYCVHPYYVKQRSESYIDDIDCSRSCTELKVDTGLEPWHFTVTSVHNCLYVSLKTFLPTFLLILKH